MKQNHFIIQTAKDYDLPYRVVEEIYNKDKKNLYEKLEEILKENQRRG